MKNNKIEKIGKFLLEIWNENFVINNAYALDFMCDQKLRRKDFDNIVIKGGNFGSDEEVENQIRLVDELSR